MLKGGRGGESERGRVKLKEGDRRVGREWVKGREGRGM